MFFTSSFARGLAASVACLLSAGSQAADWYARPSADAARDWVVDVNSSLSVASTGSVYGGVALTAAPKPEAEGLAFRVEGLTGHYTYTSGQGTRIDGQSVEGSLLAGYRIRGDRIAITAYLGVTARNNTIDIPDPTNRTVGSSLAFKTAAELYAQPTSRSMVAAYGSYSTANNAYYGRVKLGYDAGNRVYFGPEFSALGDDFYKQWRVGLHATGWRLGPFDLAVAAGLLKDHRDGFGGYSTVDARTSF